MSFIGIGSPIPEIANLPGQGGAIEVSLDYSSSAVCNDAATQSPSQAEPSGGVFSASPSGLNINTSTGVITPVGSTPNTYTITYTVSGESSSFTFTINAIQQSTFSYSSSSLEQYGTASPTLADGTTTGGTFSATSGLVINTTTGVLDLANSTIGGPYTVTYTTPGPCATSSTFNVSVTALSTSLVNNNFALSFNGSDEYVSAGNPTELQFTSDFSISGWFKSSSATNQRIVSKDDGTNRSYLIQLQSSGKVRAQIYTGGGTAQVNESVSGFGDGNWHHFVFTFENGVGTKLYIDNGTPTVDSVVSAIDNDPADFEIGRKGNSTNYFTGDIDEIAAWNRVLSADDIQRIYNGSSTSGKAANLFSTGLSNGLVYWNRMGD